MADRTRGRPRDQQIDFAVRAAVAELLDDAGYGALSMQEVARCAGVTKTALYRRWPDRPNLVLDTLRQRMDAVTHVDTGCTLCDLHDILTMTSTVFCALGPGTLARLLGESTDNAALHQQLMHDVVTPVRTTVRTTLEQARLRGDLRARADLDLSAETLCALSFQRLLLEQRPLTAAEIEHVVSAVLGGIAQDYDDLLRQFHSREGEHYHAHDRELERQRSGPGSG